MPIGLKRIAKALPNEAPLRSMSGRRECKNDYQHHEEMCDSLILLTLDGITEGRAVLAELLGILLDGREASIELVKSGVVRLGCHAHPGGEHVRRALGKLGDSLPRERKT